MHSGLLFFWITVYRQTIGVKFWNKFVHITAGNGVLITKSSQDWQSMTYNWKLSLNTGDHVLLFDLVASLRFLLLKFGPMMLTSTNGRNIPFVTHLMLLTATTAQ